MPRTILVPLDGSRFAEQALPTTAALAGRTGARLVLTRVHVPLPFEVPAGHEAMEAELLASENAYLREWMWRLAGRGIPVFGTVLPGSVAFAMRVAARSCSGALVVMASHRRGPVARAFHGSTAGSIIRSGAPVLVVGHTESTAAAFTRVLIPLDGSSAAAEAALRAFDVAGPVDYVFVSGTRNGSNGPGPGHVDAAARASLRGPRTRLEGLGARTSVERVGRGPVAEAIARMALPGDLIAMTSRRGTVGHLLFGGSTADEIMRAAPHVAALTWRPDRRGSATPSVLPAPRSADTSWRRADGSAGVPRDAARTAVCGAGAGGIA